MGKLLQLFIVDKTHAPGDLFDARDFLPLPFFDRLNKMAGIEKAVVGSGVKPSVSPPELFDRQASVRMPASASIGKCRKHLRSCNHTRQLMECIPPLKQHRGTVHVKVGWLETLRA